MAQMYVRVSQPLMDVLIRVHVQPFTPLLVNPTLAQLKRAAQVPHKPP